MQALAITPDSLHSQVTNLRGFTIHEDSSAAAEVKIRDASATGTIIWFLQLAADESASIVFGESLRAPGGVYVEEVSGSVEGSLFH